MAKKTTTLELNITSKTAKSFLADLAEQSKRAREQMAQLAASIQQAEAEMNNPTVSEERWKELKTRVSELRKQMAETERLKATFDTLRKGHISNINQLAKAMDDLSGRSLKDLNAALKEWQQQLQNMGKEENAERDLKQMMQYGQLVREIKARTAELKAGTQNLLEEAKKGLDTMHRSLSDIPGLIGAIEGAANHLSTSDNGLTRFEERLEKMAQGKSTQTLVGFYEDLANRQKGFAEGTKDYIAYQNAINHLSDQYDIIGQKQKELRAAQKAGDAELAASLQKELKQLNSGAEVRKAFSGTHVVADLKATIQHAKEGYQELMNMAAQLREGKDVEGGIGALISQMSKVLPFLRKGSEEYNNLLEAMKQVYGQDMSLEKMEEMLKGLEEQKDLLSDQPEQYKETMEVIEQLKQRIGEVRDQWKDFQEIANRYNQDGTLVDPNSRTVGEVKQDIADMEKLLRTMQAGSPAANALAEKIKNVQKTLNSAGAEAKEAEKDYEALRKEFMKNTDPLSTIKYDKLKDWEKAMREGLKTTAEADEQYVLFIQKLREVQEQTSRMEGAWKKQTSALENAASRLKSYVLAYMGFQKALDLGKEFINMNIQLSDAMSNVRKVSGMTSEGIAMLTDNLSEIGTRTNLQQLLELAYQGGKMGVGSKLFGEAQVSAMEQFTIAANKINMALGEDFGGTEAIGALAKLTDVMHIQTKENTTLSEALTKTGSAILQLGNSSTASYNHIQEFATYLGGVAATAGITMPQLLALGSTVDSMGIHIESASTSMIKFISTLVTKPEQVGASVFGATSEEVRKLQDLVWNGKTMEAMEMVFRGLKNAEGGLAGIKEKLKDLVGGGHNQRALEAMAQLTNGADTLAEHLHTSQEAFDENVAIENEYAVMNENAAASLLRLKNAFRNAFVSGEFSQTLGDIFRFFARMAEDSSHLGGKLIATFSAFFVFFNSNTQLMHAMWRKFVKGIKTGGYSMKTVLDTLKAGVLSFGKSMAKLAASTVYLAALQGAFQLVAHAIEVFTKKSKEAADLAAAFFELAQKSAQQAEGEIGTLKKRMDELNDAQGEATKQAASYRDVIVELNGKYSQYIGYIVSEAAGYREVAAALDLVLAKRKLEAYQSGIANVENEVQNRYGQRLAEGANDVRQFLYKQGITERDDINEALKIINRVVQEANANVQNGGSEQNARTLVNVDAAKAIAEKFFGQNDKALWDLLQSSALEKYAETRFDSNKLRNQLSSHLQMEMETAQEELGEAVSASVEELKDSVAAAYNTFTSALEGGKSNTDIQKARGQFIREVTRLRGAINTNTPKDSEYRTQLYEWEELAAEARIGAGWDKFVNIGQMKGNDVVAGQKAMLAAWKKVENDASDANLRAYGDVVGEDFKTFEEADEWTRGKLDEFRKRAEQLNITIMGAWRNPNGKGKGSGGDKDSEHKEQMNAYLKELESYYVRQQMDIEVARVEKEISDAEYNRRTEEMEKDHLKNRAKLRKEFLGEFGQFSEEELMRFFPEDKGMENGLKTLSGFLMKMGDEMRDDITLNMEKDLKQVKSIERKRSDAIYEALISTDAWLSAEENFKKNLDELDLLLVKSNDRTEMEAQRRIVMLARLARDFDGLIARDAHGGIDISKKGSSGQSLSDMFKMLGMPDLSQLSQDELTVLLTKIKEFKDDYEDVLRKEAKNTMKNIDTQWESSAEYLARSSNVGVAGYRKGAADELVKLGMSDAQAANKSDLELKREELAIEEAKLGFMQQQYDQELAFIAAKEKELSIQYEAAKRDHGADSKEAKEYYQSMIDAEEEYTRKKEEAHINLTEQQEKISEKNAEVMEADKVVLEEKLSKLHEYVEKVADFGGNMISASFGTKEDRQQAAKDFLKEVSEVTKKVIVAKLQQLIFERLMAKEEKMLNKDVADSTLQAKGQEVMKTLTVKGAETEANASAGISSGAAETVGQLGWWGIPLIALISAAITALMGVAMSKLNKAKNTVASALGMGKLTTGMLTYAEGRYPVLGADGNVYQAQYEGDRWKTGVYKGGAHFGILSEKQPEMVVDGPTTARLQHEHPEVIQGLLRYSHGGNLFLDSNRIGKQISGALKSAMLHTPIPTYAAGNLEQIARGAGMGMATASNPEMVDMGALTRTMDALTKRLETPLKCYINMYGEDGMYEDFKKAERKMKRVGA